MTITAYDLGGDPIDSKNLWPETVQMTDRFWHPWLRIPRLIRSILEVRRDPVTRPVMKATLTKALCEREKIRRAGWMN